MANLLTNTPLIERTPSEIWAKFGSLKSEARMGQLLSTGGWLLTGLDLDTILTSRDDWEESISVFYSFTGTEYYELETALVVLPTLQIDYATLLASTTTLTQLQQPTAIEELRIVVRNA
eukprot:CAMPEP_0170512702 /NCGR_PEP_ID=MMETSP0208-20121228/66999_1 /TAXON_ID=197538 /ORGANISM="Strombidium inclinatum, Strain S3" /LENGTH=118 /DNA_ID=CAMNT_0010796363 /DNA_START=393 /DNA_END=745 /DNA_ORIENTATION=+